MKTLIAVAALGLLTAPAFAGEGTGNPFPFRAPTSVISLQNYKQAPGTNQNPFPFSAPASRQSTVAVLPPDGSQGVVQTANSLPPGAEDPTPNALQLNQPSTRVAAGLNAQPHG